MAFDRLLADQLNTTEERYNAAIDRHIKMNACITREKKFFAEHSDAQEITDFLAQYGREGELQGNGFLSKMANALEEWGSLTDGQLAPVRKAMAKAAERKAKFEKMKADQAAKSNFVGTVGERQEFTIFPKHVVVLDDYGFGISYLNICEDADGNSIIYKGSRCFVHMNCFNERDNENPKDIKIVCHARVEAHTVYNGAKQTKISRPTKVVKTGCKYDWDFNRI